MLTLEDARARVLDGIQPTPDIETIDTVEAAGRYLAEGPKARVASPAFDNSAMDGFAVRTADLGEAGGELPVAFTVAAGDDPEALPSRGCTRIMTGAALPAGADAVVMQEQVESDGETAHFSACPPAGNNIRQAGEDIRSGAELAAAGERVSPALVSALATAGVAQLRVRRRPRAFVLATGSELRGPGEALGPGEVYDSNRPALAALLRELGAEVTDGGHVPDELDALREALRHAAGYDLVVTSGGVSVGEFDQVRRVLEEQGEIDLWKVAIKPGKPFAFGSLGGAHFFGMPGNPVSALVTFQQFVRPAVIRWMGGAADPLRLPAEAGNDFYRDAISRTEFLRARLQLVDGRLVATPLSRQGSGMITGLARAHGFIVVAAGSHGFKAGERVMVEPTSEWCRFGEPQSRGEE